MAEEISENPLWHTYWLVRFYRKENKQVKWEAGAVLV
jgi:hypothetical protein